MGRPPCPERQEEAQAAAVGQPLRVAAQLYDTLQAFFRGEAGGKAVRDAAAGVTALVREGYARRDGVDIDALRCE